VTIAPEQNTLLVFPSSLGHEVTPVTQATGNFADFRFVVNCWLHRSNA
jgi:Rps23 Pro-64 3,4-dihydroxylase Tpa1-like proline 4-hydroxylase